MSINKNDFSFKVFNNRRSSFITYRVQKTEEGWHIRHIAINGNCDPKGHPFFQMNFDQDYIITPSDFGVYLERLWEDIEYNNIDHDEAQKRLQQLADWVTVCEKSRPLWEGWNC